ncbi:hypothetical protein SUGI_0097710 [Cryptomeria japonica]|nr:hypothetical protein SUGI_0097710 [Cryptomeria japonica]
MEEFTGKADKDKNGGQKLSVRMSNKCKRGGVKYRGVRQSSPNRYVAYIRDPIKKKNVHLGVFATPESAAYAYDFAARTMRGSRAITNFFYFKNNSQSANLSQTHLQHVSNAMSSLPFFPPSSFLSPQNFYVPSSSQNTLTNFPSIFNKPSFLNAATTINAVPIAQRFPNPVESFCLQPLSEHRVLDPFRQGSSSSSRPITGNEKKHTVDGSFSESSFFDSAVEISTDPVSSNGGNENKNTVDGIFSESSFFDSVVGISTDPLSFNGEHANKGSSGNVGLDSDISQHNEFLFLTNSIISSSIDSEPNCSSSLDSIGSLDYLISDNHDLKEMNCHCLGLNSQQIEDGVFSGSSLFDPTNLPSSNGEHGEKIFSSSVCLDSDISQQNEFLFLTDSIISSSIDSEPNCSSNLDCIDSIDFLNATTTINEVPVAKRSPNPVESFSLQPFPFSQGSSSSSRPITGNEKKHIVDGSFSESSFFDSAVEISTDPLSSNGGNEKKITVDGSFSESSLFDSAVEISIGSLSFNGEHANNSSSGSVGLDSDISEHNEFLLLTDSIISFSIDSQPNCSSGLDSIDNLDYLTSDNHDLKEMKCHCLGLNSQRTEDGVFLESSLFDPTDLLSSNDEQYGKKSFSSSVSLNSDISQQNEFLFLTDSIISSSIDSEPNCSSSLDCINGLDFLI